MSPNKLFSKFCSKLGFTDMLFIVIIIVCSFVRCCYYLVLCYCYSQLLQRLPADCVDNECSPVIAARGWLWLITVKCYWLLIARFYTSSHSLNSPGKSWQFWMYKYALLLQLRAMVHGFLVNGKCHFWGLVTWRSLTVTLTYCYYWDVFAIVWVQPILNRYLSP